MKLEIVRRFHGVVILAAMFVALLFLVQARAVSASTLYVCSTNGVLYKSVDGGKTWQALPVDSGTALTVSSEVIVDPQDPATVYVPRASLSISKGATTQPIRKLFRTADSGKTWASMSLPADASTVHFAVDPTSRNVLYLGSGGVYRSRDSGQTWEGPALPRASVFSVATDRRQPGVVYASLTSDGLYRSADFGSTWTKISSLDIVPTNVFSSMAVDPRDSTILYGTSSGGLYRSIDTGRNWTRVVAGSFENVVFDLRTHAIYAAGLSAPASDGITRSALAVRSTDGGTTWTVLSKGFAQSATAKIYPDPDTDGTLYALQITPSRSGPSEGHILVTNNAGANWSPTPINAANEPLESMGVASGNAAPAAVTHVLAAGFRGGALAPDSIVTAIGTGLADATAAATSDPPPVTLGGTAIAIVDSKGVRWQAPLFYVSPGQINYLIPAGVASGAAVVTVQKAGAAALDQSVLISATSPGVFTLNAGGLVAAGVLRVSGGQQVSGDVYRVDASGNVVAQPIDLGGAGDQVYLLIYGTGFRAAKTEGVKVTIAGQPAQVAFAGAQGAFAGLDQVNLLMPQALAHSGDVEIKLSAAGEPANTVHVTIQ